MSLDLLPFGLYAVATFGRQRVAGDEALVERLLGTGAGIMEV